MAKLPDGHIFIYKPKRLKIEIEERELVMCRNCKWRSNHGATSTSWLPCMDNSYPDDWFCKDGERSDDT